jgi:transposase InsO family protein
MSERLEFIKACLDRTEHIVRICDRFGISEKTGQKWLKRFREGDIEALDDRSHAPLSHAGRITPEVRDRILALKKKYPLYGPDKLHDWLVIHEPRESGLRWPAVSSIGELLKRHGLVRRKRKHQMVLEHSDLSSVRTRSTEPNMVWTADFKGEFRLRNGLGDYCYPLTVLDLNTHYLLGCTALSTTAVLPTKHAFERLFSDYGLPMVMRTDNGVPFAQPNAVGRIGKLAFWWVQLGIRPEYITPGRPSENGAHERFHRTLKAAATKPSSKSLNAQQKRFDEFRTEYNVERPHKSLPERRPPAQFYEPSTRPYPGKLPVMIYSEDSTVRLVDGGGNIKWRNNAFFLSTNLIGQYVSLSEGDDDLIRISYGKLELGAIDPEINRFKPSLKWHG